MIGRILLHVSDKWPSGTMCDIDHDKRILTFGHPSLSFIKAYRKTSSGKTMQDTGTPQQIIIHVDMDAFYASVEVRDDPSLCGKALIIGSLPGERGVVCTCSYEAREFGVRSAMNIKEAYRRCPDGIYMHPNFSKYKEASAQVHRIWDSYATAVESVALDEAYLDVTETAGTFERAREFALEIKRRVKEEVGLTCSVGVAYSKTAAKTASEENKPNGFFEIPTPDDFVNLIIDREVDVLYTVGRKTAEKLRSMEIFTVRELRDRESEVIATFGKHGRWLVQLAYGIDTQKVVPYKPEDAKSVSREITFQKNVSDRPFLKDVLLLLSVSVVERARTHGLQGKGVVLKITYGNMQSISRSRLITAHDDAYSVYREACRMLDSVSYKDVRLIGVGIYNVIQSKRRQLTLDDLNGDGSEKRRIYLSNALDRIGRHYGLVSVLDPRTMGGLEELHRVVGHMHECRANSPWSGSYLARDKLSA